MSADVVRELVAKLGIDIDEKTFKTAETLIAGLKTGLIAALGATAGVVGGLLAVATSTASAANEARKAAIRTGTTVEAYQELKFAAEAAGVDVGSLETALFRMSAASYQARQGSAAAAAAFHGLLSSKDLKTLSPDQQFEKLAEGLIAIKDAGERAAKVRAIFGRGGNALLPLLARGKEGIRELREEAHKLGVVLDQETIANAKEFRRDLHELEAGLEGVKFQVGAFVLGGLVKMARGIKSVVTAFNQWRKAHWDTIVKAFRLALITAGVALAAFAVANAAAIGATLLAWAGLAAGAVASAAVVAASWLAAAAPFIPLAAAALLAVLVLEDIFGFYTGKKSVLGDMVADVRAAGGAWEYFKNVLQGVAKYAQIVYSVLSNGPGAALAFGASKALEGTAAGNALSYVSTGLGSAASAVQRTFSSAPVVNVAVHAAPGMDESALAQQVVRQVSEQLDRITREAQAAAQ